MKAWITWSPLITAGFGCLVFFAASKVAVSAQQFQPEQRLSTIKGIVSNAVSSEGLRKAYVRLMGKGEPYPAVTDDTGRFVIENIQPGTYSLEAERQGFILSRFGEEPGVRLVEIQLTPGQVVTDIKIKLVPQAVISGRVVDEDGDIWTHSHVGLFRSTFAHGRRRLQGFSGGEVNDQAEFRIGQLPPGRYYLSAEPDLNWESRNRPPLKEAVLSRQLTWYPSSPDAEGSTAITVGPGDQLSGLEIRLRRGSVHAIRGTLVGVENMPDDRGPYAERRISANRSTAEANGRNGTIRADGTFEIPNVPSGTYEIRVAQGFLPVNLGSAKVQVDDRDLENVSIQLVPPRPLKGIVQFEDEVSAKLSALRIQLEPFVAGWSPPAVSREDGSFEFTLIASERYRININAGPGHYLKEIRYGDAVSHDGTISLTGPVESLLLILSTRVARVTGKVTGAIASTPQVVMVPNGRLGDARLATFDQNRGFSLSDVPPGAYKLYAFESVPDGAWEDSDLMKEISGSGTEIKLAEGDATRVDLPLLLKSTLAPILKKLGME